MVKKKVFSFSLMLRA